MIAGRSRREGPSGKGSPRSTGLRCTPEETSALKRLAAIRTAGVWRIKRAKIILGTLGERSAEQLMWDVRVPVKTVLRFQRLFAQARMAAFERRDRKPTAREAAVERMLQLLEDPPPETSPLWETTVVHYIGRDYTARDVAGLRCLVQARPTADRAALAREACRAFGLYGSNGRARTPAAIDVLVRMDMDNLIRLPARQKRTYRTTRHLGREEKPCSPEPAVGEADTRHLSMVLVRDERSSRLWRETIERHHYIAQHRLYGAQLRYLVYGSATLPTRPEDGALLAVLGFASAAWRLTARDEFIGWANEERTKNLRLVVGNARFLIVPWVRVKCLASRILSAVVRRLPGDWERRYGFRPVLLETFVQLDRFSGTCYRAANWVQVGTTRGYSVHGSEFRTRAPARAILLYPLRKDFRRALRGAAASTAPPEHSECATATGQPVVPRPMPCPQRGR